jgi:WD40 repeat protein
MGFSNGSVRIWDAQAQAHLSSFKEHSGCITSIRFVSDKRLLLSSGDKTASIVTLDGQLQVSCIRLIGHTDQVNDILHLPSSNQCVTCSGDNSVKVWDCNTATCLRTLVKHSSLVKVLALHPTKSVFASGAYDCTAIIWSSDTFEVLQQISLPHGVQSLAFGEGDILYAGVYSTGVMSCDTVSGELGPLLIARTGEIPGLVIGMARS